MKPTTMKTKQIKEMQHESSIIHRRNLESGLTVKWERSTGNGDNEWSVVCYSDDARWLFDNSGAQELEVLGEVSDGLNKAEILENGIGAVIALYWDGPQSFDSREAWLGSMPDGDKAEAAAMLEQLR